MLPIFKTFLFGKLSHYFKREDTFKDGNDQGLLERYLQVFGDELDENISGDIDDYLDIIHPLLADEKFLNLIAYNVGNPPDIFNDVDQYRIILSNILSVYKVKGTIQSYQVWFSMLGFDLVVITEFPQLNVIYDDGNLYDNDDPATDDDETWKYDSYCGPCSEYSISFGTSNNDPIDQTTLDILHKAIPFVEPINAKLRNLIFGLTFEDIANYCGLENLTLTNLNSLLYNDGNLYDDSLLYDFQTTGDITNFSSSC